MARNTSQEQDVKWMRRALRLAQRGLGSVSPNPLVGAVIVKNGVLLGEGWHERPGSPHAEINALASLRSPRSARGATIYVTLEPCCTFGRTPPCCDAIIAAGIRRVVIGSFGVLSNAQALCQQLRDNGYEGQIVKNEARNMFRVVASSFDKKADAVSSRDAIRGSQFNPKGDAWLLYNAQ